MNIHKIEYECFCYEMINIFAIDDVATRLVKSEAMHLGFHGIGRNGKEVFRKVFDCRRLGIICSFEITLSPIFPFSLFYFLCKPGVIDRYRSLRDRFVYARFGLLQCDKYREITKAI